MESEEINTYNPAISFGVNKWSFSASYDYLETFEMETTDLNTGDEIFYTPYYHIIRGNAGYQISNDFSVGLGLSHIKDFQGYYYDLSSDTQDKLDLSGLTFSLGSYYTSEFESANFRIRPQAGLAFTDIGSDFNQDGDYASLPPAQTRLGFGIDFTLKNKMYNQSIFSLGVYTGFSKYISRVEEDGSRPTGISAIFTTWSSIDYFNGIEYETITVGDQISKSIGIEAGFLETLYFRFGAFGGADYWVRPQATYGVALDLYYVSFSYAHIHYNEENFANENQSAFQMQVRIPLDGNGESNLLSEIF